jgi:hypothetical protein
LYNLAPASRSDGPFQPSSKLDALKEDFVRLAQDLSDFNPHLKITLTWGGRKEVTVEATDPTWRKWRPSDPLVAHWYDLQRFNRLIAAKIAHAIDHGRELLVREFIAGFKGMTRSAAQKAVLDAIGGARMSLATLFKDGRQDDLLALLKDQTKPLQPAELGVIGRDHLEDALWVRRPTGKLQVHQARWRH